MKSPCVDPGRNPRLSGSDRTGNGPVDANVELGPVDISGGATARLQGTGAQGQQLHQRTLAAHLALVEDRLEAALGRMERDAELGRG